MDASASLAETGRPALDRSLKERFLGRAVDGRTAGIVATVGLLAVPVMVVLVMGWTHRWTADDGFINFRIVDMIRHGYGPVFNPGARVEAETSPLWIGILALGDIVVPLRLEWIAVLLGLALMAAGLAFAEVGSAGLWRRVGGDGGAIVPAGALVFAALAPVWDFSTAGLDVGLDIAWLGMSWWALTRAVVRSPRCADAPRTPWWACLLLGLGPLSRPDLAVMTLAFAAALLLAEATWRLRLRVLALVAVLPVAYQLFRMTYYAALVPNTAITKEAGSTDWSRGWTYFVDFLGTYQWWIPLVLLIAVALIPLLRSESVRSSPTLRALILAPLIAGLLHGLYVVAIGGDFMHARMLLPSLWCVLLPTAAVKIRGWQWLPSAGIAVWVLVCALFLRVGYVVRDITTPGKIGPVATHALITNQRGEFVAFSGRANPVTLDDYRRAIIPWVRASETVRQRAERGERGVLVDGFDAHGPLLPATRGLTTSPIVAIVTNIGMYSYAVGPHVYVVDRDGVADPLAARLALERGTAGHEKTIDTPWEVARFVDPSAAPRTPAVEAAQQALKCGELPRLFRDVDEPLGLSRAWHNFWDSFALTSLRIPRRESTAARVLCAP